ncbi:MAG: flagellar biosynthetic protein FliR [Rickettsiales bacterium]|nr:flagellar biosynthetic protein FliR [Rickettsiales bacterium]
MVMPGIGESYIPPRVRLLASLTISLVLLPTLTPVLPSMPSDVPSLFLDVGGEITIGAFIGLLTRMFISVMHMAGMIIAYQSGLASAVMFDPTSESQGTTIGNFMALTAVALLMITDFHHLMLYALRDSYHVFAPGAKLPVGDMAETATATLADAFLIALQFSSPHIVIGLLLYLTAGLMSRVMPNMQVFFILMPLQILLSIFVMAVTLSGGMLWYIGHMQEQIGIFAAPSSISTR